MQTNKSALLPRASPASLALSALPDLSAVWEPTVLGAAPLPIGARRPPGRIAPQGRAKLEAYCVRLGTGVQGARRTPSHARLLQGRTALQDRATLLVSYALRGPSAGAGQQGCRLATQPLASTVLRAHQRL